MKIIPALLQTHLDSGTTTLAYCWKITPNIGSAIGFTDHDVDLVVDSLTYKANQGYTSSSLDSTASSTVDNSSASFLLNFEGTEEDKLLAGDYDFAEVEIFMVNYESISDGIIRLKKGFIGEIKIGDIDATAEINGLSQKLEQTALELYSPNCRAALGDSRCKFNLTPSPFTVSGNVTGVTDNRIFNTSITTQPNDFYKYGLLTWNSGNNVNRRQEVKAYTQAGGIIELFDTMLDIVQIGDTFTLTTGCDKMLSTCRDKFSNVVNFRGEPFVPSRDVI